MSDASACSLAGLAALALVLAGAGRADDGRGATVYVPEFVVSYEGRPGIYLSANLSSVPIGGSVTLTLVHTPQPGACLQSLACTATLYSFPAGTIGETFTDWGTFVLDSFNGDGSKTVSLSAAHQGVQEFYAVVSGCTSVVAGASQGVSVTVGPRRLGDANGDGTTDVLDVFHLINFLFAGGPAPL